MTPLQAFVGTLAIALTAHLALYAAFWIAAFWTIAGTIIGFWL